MYRFLTETLLGVHLEGNRLRVIPRFPPSWTNYKIHYRHRQTLYHITISRLAPDRTGANELSLDGQTLAEETIPLTDDHLEHFVELRAR
jgi:cellobiose phosphorylase